MDDKTIGIPCITVIALALIASSAFGKSIDVETSRVIVPIITGILGVITGATSKAAIATMIERRRERKAKNEESQK
jgi:hypothetical protein